MMTCSTATQSTHNTYSQLAQMDKELSENLQQLTLPTEQLRPFAQELARYILLMIAKSAPVTHTHTEEEAAEAVTEHLLNTEAIPLMPVVADFFLRAGLNYEHLRYGSGLEGLLVARIDGIQLMEFAGFTDTEAPTITETDLLLSLTDNDPKH